MAGNNARPLVTDKRQKARTRRSSANLPKFKPPAGGLANVLFPDLRLSLCCYRQMRGGSHGPPPHMKDRLLYFDLAACIFKFLLRGVGFSLVGSFEHRLGRA